MATRAEIMRSIRSTNTGPELTVRRLVHSMGYRYRLHRRDLPSTPDLVFPARHKVIFVHGCFWHGHTCQRGNRQPKTNSEYWRQKIDRNRKRDVHSIHALQAKGWDALVIWECQMKDTYSLRSQIKRFLG